MSGSALYPAFAPALNRGGLAVAVALHGLVFWGLLRTGAVVLPKPPAVLAVRLLPPAAAARPEPAIAPPPAVRQARPRPPPLQSTAPADAPTPPAAPSSAPPTPAMPAVQAAAATPVAAPVQTIAPPRFDADYLDNPKPAYPPISRRLGEQGHVVLRVHVDADGRALDIQLHTPSGSSRLDQSALDAVRRWKFVPARHGQAPVAAWVLVPIAFTLKD